MAQTSIAELLADKEAGLDLELLAGRRAASLPKAGIAPSLVRVDTHRFLVYANYEALLSYNCAHTYALSVAFLADRIGNR